MSAGDTSQDFSTTERTRWTAAPAPVTTQDDLNHEDESDAYVEDLPMIPIGKIEDVAKRELR